MYLAEGSKACYLCKDESKANSVDMRGQFSKFTVWDHDKSPDLSSLNDILNWVALSASVSGLKLITNLFNTVSRYTTFDFLATMSS